jgi:hypothetical protein
MSRDDVLKELMERRVRREADDRDAEAGTVQCLVKLEFLAVAWRDAQDDAAAAYRLWSRAGGPDAYAIYRAAQDRADEAQDALWRQHILSGGAPRYEGWVVS